MPRPAAPTPPVLRIAADLPGRLRPWLVDAGSLTAHLQRACRARGGRFRVTVLDNRRARPLPGERRALGLRPRTEALVREVCLGCDGSPWVFARSIVPPASLRGPGRQLAMLGDRPLGAFLFASRRLERCGPRPLRPGAEPLLEARAAEALGTAAVFGRRSLFRVAGHPLLVQEFFSPAMPPFPGPWRRPA